MPIRPKYPGMYVEEIPSGAHTIAGTSTSIGAFVGTSSRGPLNQPLRCRSFADYEKSFGGLDDNSDMSFAVNQFFLNGGTDCWVVSIGLAPTESEESGASLYLGDGETTGMYALNTVEFNILCLPGVTNAPTQSKALEYCRDRRAFFVGDLPQDFPGSGPSSTLPNNDLNVLRSTAADHGGVYHPWIQISDPTKETPTTKSIPPSGTIAGIYARTDSARGVWKSPAGLEATLSGAVGLDVRITDAQNNTFNQNAVNCLRSFSAGLVVWGARTIAGYDSGPNPDYRYVSVRRLALYVESSLYEGTQWAVFEPNDETLWASLRVSVGSFMHDLFRQGAFPATTPRDSYFVKCDRETTTQDDIDNGRVNIQVGFAPLRPAEFVILSIQQMAGQ